MILYAYGVVQGARTVPPGLRGVEGAPVSVLPVGSLSCVVSALHSEPAELGVDDVTAHATVVQILFGAGPILPFRVGMVGEEETLRGEVTSHLPLYAAQLRRVAGHCELEVRAWLEEEPALADVLDASPQARTLSAGIGPESPFEDQLRLGEFLASALEVRRQLAASRLDERLASLAVEISPMEPAPGEAFRAAYLVPAARTGEFTRQAVALGVEIPGMRVDVAGPVPPYSFAEPFDQ